MFKRLLVALATLSIVTQAASKLQAEIVEMDRRIASVNAEIQQAKDDVVRRQALIAHRGELEKARVALDQPKELADSESEVSDD